TRCLSDWSSDVCSSDLVLFNKKNLKYGINLFSGLTDISYVKHLLAISWPVVLDKSIMAWAYVWLGKMIATMGTGGIAAFCVVKEDRKSVVLYSIHIFIS